MDAASVLIAIGILVLIITAGTGAWRHMWAEACKPTSRTPPRPNPCKIEPLAKERAEYRDKVAIAAMKVMLTRPEYLLGNLDLVTSNAYRVADAMWIARNGSNQPVKSDLK